MPILQLGRLVYNVINLLYLQLQLFLGFAFDTNLCSNFSLLRQFYFIDRYTVGSFTHPLLFILLLYYFYQPQPTTASQNIIISNGVMMIKLKYYYYSKSWLPLIWMHAFFFFNVRCVYIYRFISRGVTYHIQVKLLNIFKVWNGIYFKTIIIPWVDEYKGNYIIIYYNSV